MEESGIRIALLPEAEEDRRAKEIKKKRQRRALAIVSRLVCRGRTRIPYFSNSYPMAEKRPTLEKLLKKDPKVYATVRFMIVRRKICTRSDDVGQLAFDCSKMWYVSHVFIDANHDACFAVAYIRIDTTTGPFCSFVISRSKAAPLQHMSTLRLELQATVLGARLAN